jgi:hypothetical protein
MDGSNPLDCAPALQISMLQTLAHQGSASRSAKPNDGNQNEVANQRMGLSGASAASGSRSRIFPSCGALPPHRQTHLAWPAGAYDGRRFTHCRMSQCLARAMLGHRVHGCMSAGATCVAVLKPQHGNSCCPLPPGYHSRWERQSPQTSSATRACCPHCRLHPSPSHDPPCRHSSA